LGRSGEILYLEPIYPFQGWINGLTLALPVSILFSGWLTVNDIRYPWRPEFRISPMTLASYSLTAAIAGFDLALLLGRRRYLNKIALLSVRQDEWSQAVKEDYERGETMLSLGRLEEALREYAKIVQDHPDSIYFPQALFKLAKIHDIQGNYSVAALEFQVITELYPLPDLYDKSQKSLSGIYLRQGDYSRSIDTLDNLTHIDPLYSEENVDFYRCGIYERWYEQDPEKLDILIQAYGDIVDSYQDSANSALYRFRLAFYLNQAGETGQAEAVLDKIDLSVIDEGLREKVQALRRSIGGGR
jgi:tetratricopeptide (TPR) repeat protein